MNRKQTRIQAERYDAPRMTFKAFRIRQVLLQSQSGYNPGGTGEDFEPDTD